MQKWQEQVEVWRWSTKNEPPYPRDPSKGNPSVESLDSDNCFHAEEAVVDQQQAQLPTSALLADIPSPSYQRWKQEYIN